MSTPHIEAEKGAIAKTVLMPGDPLRAKYIAETYLEDVVKFNNIRNMFGYTGTYKGKRISVMGSGMGMPSVGIYSYELFKFYDVENIIRIGSSGSYSEKLKIYDVILVEKSWSESSYANVQGGTTDVDTTYPSAELNKELQDAANKLKVNLTTCPIHSSDVFYREDFEAFKQIRDEHGCLAVEMESFALFHNAKVTGKNAACLLTVSDSLITNEVTTAEERQFAFTKMMDIALEAAK